MTEDIERGDLIELLTYARDELNLQPGRIVDGYFRSHYAGIPMYKEGELVAVIIDKKSRKKLTRILTFEKEIIDSYKVNLDIMNPKLFDRLYRSKKV